MCISLQVSYGDTNPILSDRTKYPNFYRTVPSDADFNLARIRLLQHYGWTRVGTLFQDASSRSALHANVIIINSHRLAATSFANVEYNTFLPCCLRLVLQGSIRVASPCFRKKTRPFVISSYLCFESYELHENFQKYIGDVACCEYGIIFLIPKLFFANIVITKRLKIII